MSRKTGRLRLSGERRIKSVSAVRLVLSLSFMVSFAVPAPAEELPSVPDLAPWKDEFDATAWQRIEAAADRLRSELRSAEASGRLGMILHAHDRYKLAEPLYLRSHLLAPDHYPWAYYLGVVPGPTGNAGGSGVRVSPGRGAQARRPPGAPGAGGRPSATGPGG